MSPVVDSLKNDKHMDHAACMEFEFMNRVPVMPDFFYKICNDRCVAKVIATHADKSSIVPILSFLDIEVTKARVYYLRVLTMLSDKDINDVMEMRTEDPVLPVKPSLKDLMIFITQFDRLSANSSHRHRVPGLLQKYGLTRAAKIEEGLSHAEKIDVLSMLVSCLAHLAAKDTSIAFVVRRHLQNFMSRLANFQN